jgi:hypothetical protein
MTAAIQDHVEPRLEAQLAGGIRLYDAHRLLRRGARPPGRRAVSSINRIYVHHSGKLGAPGLEGLQVSADFSVRRSGFRTTAYHVWVPHAPVYDDDGDLVCYRGACDSWITNHTKGLNVRGFGVCLQGNTSTDGLSPSQAEILLALLPWCRERFELGWDDPDWLSWHSDSGRFGGRNPKPSCPGREAVAWLTDYRARSV